MLITKEEELTNEQLSKLFDEKIERSLQFALDTADNTEYAIAELAGEANEFFMKIVQIMGKIFTNYTNWLNTGKDPDIIKLRTEVMELTAKVQNGEVSKEVYETKTAEFYTRMEELSQKKLKSLVDTWFFDKYKIELKSELGDCWWGIGMLYRHLKEDLGSLYSLVAAISDETTIKIGETDYKFSELNRKHLANKDVLDTYCTYILINITGLCGVYAKYVRDKDKVSKVDREILVQKLQTKMAEFVSVLLLWQSLLEMDLFEILDYNYEKLSSRFSRGKIVGGGDNR